ncbi:beta-N-acetylglucosaminidase domain-containing protein [Flexivirga sp. B27]
MVTTHPSPTPAPLPRHRIARRTTVALGTAVALAFSLAGTAAAPAHAAGKNSTAPTTSALPKIFPQPQQMQASGAPVPLSGKVQIVTGDNADQPTVELVTQLVKAAGGTPTVVKTASGGGKRIYLGTVANNPAIDDVVGALGTKDATGLKADGYVLATGRYDDKPTVVLNGVDQRGTFYAAQTLRQLITHKRVPGVSIRDWPLMSIRGAIEGFYGIPWSHQARLDQMAFYGKHKMNTYIYTPKDDQLLRAKWRTPYSGDDLTRMQELVKTANANHVDFTFALSPGNDICYSSQSDFDATVKKFDQLRNLGVRSFYIALDDIPLKFHCDADKQKYPDNGDWHWLADAQADYLNKLQKEYIEPNHLEPLQTVPTNYNGSGPDPYKAEFGARLGGDVRVQWTGEGVFSDTITAESVQRASTSYNTDHLYIWDNFPVNDGKRGRLFLNPLTGRAPDLYKYIDGFTSNPMIEPYASMPALANYGDYTWNGPQYDADASMSAALDELAGPDQGTREALRTFADLNQEWPYRDSTQKAPALSKDIAAFWTAREDGTTGGTALAKRLAAIVDLPHSLSAMAQRGFTSDTKPWADAASLWAKALQHEIAMLKAIDADDGAKATAEYFAAQKLIDQAKQPTVPDQDSSGAPQPNQIVPTVGDGAFGAFTAKANKELINWLGAKPIDVNKYPSTPSTSMGTYSTYAIGRMTDDDTSTYYWSNAAPSVGSNVQVDLGSVQQVGNVVVRQSDNDTETGDMIYHAALEYSTDGQNWSTAGEFDTKAVIQYSFDKPVQARYVRLRATATNPGGKWVKIRDFAVSATSPASSNLPATDGTSPAEAFDANLTTAYHAASKPVDGSYLAHTYDDPVSLHQLSVVASAGSGELQVQHDGTWSTVGTLASGSSYATGDVDPSWQVTGVRMLFTPGSAAPEINELAAR